jgi:hypothetical protein
MERRPDGVTILAVYHWFLAALSLLGICGTVCGMFFVIVGKEQDILAALFWMVFGLFVAAMGVVANGLVGWGLWGVKPWARIGAIVLAVLHLPGFPIGTLIGALILWYLLTDPDAKAAFGVT